MSYHNGFEGGFQVDDPENPGETLDFDITGWEGTESNPSRRVTTTKHYDPVKDKCFEARFHGTHQMTGTIEFPYDNTQPRSLEIFRTGRKLKDVKLIATNGLEVHMPSAYIPENPVNPGGMDDVFRMSVQFESDGPYHWFGEEAEEPPEPPGD